jgi:tryptophan 7-halogenase
MPALDLIRLVEQLGAPYGLERSVKIMPRALYDDRCLISIGRAALGGAPVERLLQMGNELQMPPAFAEALPAALQRADIVHFGYEAAAGHEVYKVYFEYASDVRAAIAANGQDPVLVHLAYKWTPRRADSGALTRYSWVRCGTRSVLEARLRALLPEEDAPRALRCALGLVSRTTALADSGELMLMEVEEPGNTRRSCDLNVYDAGLQLRDIASLLDATLRDFEVPTARARSTFGRSEPTALGHLSAGLARDGSEFVTVYFGVEGH